MMTDTTQTANASIVDERIDGKYAGKICTVHRKV